MDGTTDVTRTFSYGEPTEFMKEAYTRVLAGAIDLARATFPDGTPETRLDILARWNLMRVGLNYNHGTGHGIAAYGLVHESPTQVRIYKEEEHPMRQVHTFKMGNIQDVVYGRPLSVITIVKILPTLTKEKERREGGTI